MVVLTDMYKANADIDDQHELAPTNEAYPIITPINSARVIGLSNQIAMDMTPTLRFDWTNISPLLSL